MAVGLVRVFAALVHRAGKKLRSKSYKRVIVPFFSSKKMISGRRSAHVDDDEEGDGVWRREILMGEKCQPLEFSGVIYYDTEGRRLSEIPTPKSPMRGGRSPLPSFPLPPEMS